MIDSTKPGSSGWWLDRLVTELAARQTRLTLLGRYMDGDAPLPEGAVGLRAAYQTFQKKSRTNFAELVVEAPAERMLPSGFRVGDGTNLDKTALKIWSANELDASACDVHMDMLGLGDGYVIVGGPEKMATRYGWLPLIKTNRGDIPVITREDPRFVVTAHDPLMPNRVIAALKLYRDDVALKDYAYLYGPGIVYKASRKIENSEMTIDISGFDWESSARLPRGFEDVVPVVRFKNRRGLGEFETHIDLLDRINYMLLQRLVTASLQAYRQRAIKNADKLPDVELDADGNPVLDDDDNPTPVDYQALFKPGPGALWLLPEGAEPWESQYTDLTPMLAAVKDDIRDLAAVTRTPMSMLLPEGANQSAEGATYAREGLVFKTQDRIKRASYGWNQVMALALRFSGKAKVIQDIETLWLPPERLSLSERADACSKLVDVPWKTRMTDIMQFPPEKVEDMETERLADVLATSLATPQNNNVA